MRKRYAARIFCTFLASVILPSICFAQDDTPADGCDPYDGCAVPLDTWVYVLVIAAVIYGAYRMHQKQKALTA
ncbi:MAG: hypothetical protein V4456_01650 [Bacteroidota bacterium]